MENSPNKKQGNIFENLIRDIENPEDAFTNILKISNFDITDSTRVVCDICCSYNSEKNFGGAVLLEKEGSQAAKLGWFTYSCQNCFDNFVMKKGIKQNDEKSDTSKIEKVWDRARRNKVGTDIKSYFIFDQSKTFKQNVLQFKKETRDKKNISSSWKSILEDSNEKGEESHYENRGFNATCSGCKKTFKLQQLKRCSRCKLSRYCSKKCQSENWNIHKENCDLACGIDNTTKLQQQELNTTKDTTIKIEENFKKKEEKDDTKSKNVESRIPVGSRSILWDPPNDNYVPPELRPALARANANGLFLSKEIQIFQASQLLVHKMNTQKYYAEEEKNFEQNRLDFKKNFVEKILPSLKKYTGKQLLEVYINCILDNFKYATQEEKQRIKEDVLKLEIPKKERFDEEYTKLLSTTFSKVFIEKGLAEKEYGKRDYWKSILYVLLERVFDTFELVFMT